MQQPQQAETAPTHDYQNGDQKDGPAAPTAPTLLTAMERDYQRTLAATRSHENEGEEAEGYGYEAMPVLSDDEENGEDAAAANGDHDPGEDAAAEEEQAPPPEEELAWIADFAAGELAEPVRFLPDIPRVCA